MSKLIGNFLNEDMVTKSCSSFLAEDNDLVSGEDKVRRGTEVHDSGGKTF